MIIPKCFRFSVVATTIFCWIVALFLVVAHAMALPVSPETVSTPIWNIFLTMLVFVLGIFGTAFWKMIDKLENINNRLVVIETQHKDFHDCPR